MLVKSVLMVISIIGPFGDVELSQTIEWDHWQSCVMAEDKYRAERITAECILVEYEVDILDQRN